MRPSIGRRLLLLLVVSILSIGGLQTWLCFRASRMEADVFYDKQMSLLAEAIGNAARSMTADTGDVPVKSGLGVGFTIRIRPDSAGAADPANPDQSSNAQELTGFSTALGADGELRTYRLRSVHGTIVEVSQNTGARTEMAAAMALGTVWPVFAFTPIVLLATWWLVRHGMAPVRRVGHALAARNQDDLSPVEDRDVPIEVALLVDEINRLLGRIDALLAVQRQFVGDAAHELRSPLTALKLQLQALADGARSVPPELAAKLQRLDRGVERMHRIVEQLLDLSRSEARPDRDGPVVAVELADTVRRSVTELSESAEQRDIAIGVVVKSEARVAGDASELAMLVSNLLDNAVKFSPTGSIVDVEVEVESGATTLRIADAGPGIAPAERERVFDRFYRIPGNGVPGSGLGLAIARTVAKRIGASVTLSDSSRGGLCVTVVFSPSAVHSPLETGVAERAVIDTEASSRAPGALA